MREYINRDDLRLSLKFGFLGIGMGGNAIAYECASVRTKIPNNFNPYTALLINTNDVDLQRFKEQPNIKKYQLKGYEKGAGRDPIIGEEAFLAHKEEIKQHIEEMFSDRDFVWIIVGLGGGTGTGALLEAVKTVLNAGFHKKCGFILTMPRDQEGLSVLENAIDRLQTFSQAMKNLGGILPVDNKKLYNSFIKDHPNASINQYLDYSNKFIAETLHEWNIVTASFDPIGGYHFDSSEFLNTLNTPGILSLGKVKLEAPNVDVEQDASYLPTFKRSIESGILSDGYNFNDANRLAVSVVASKNNSERIFTMKFINKIEQTVEELAPFAGEKPISSYQDNKANNDVSLYSIVAGLRLPARVKEMVIKVNELREKNESSTDDIFSSLQSFSKRERKTESLNVADLFAAPAKEDVKNTKPTEIDPFKV
ncbi:plasmid replication protein [Paenibacillus sp. IITD108]|uniref:plasmid replication protein n=1 Tax=Paenibacillus sp. IITD108 TaxID=3116649 RepID=UPI002F41B9A6